MELHNEIIVQSGENTTEEANMLRSNKLLAALLFLRRDEAI
jgi:hypothetical protein